MAADDDRHARREPTDLPCEPEDLVGLERVHAGDADETRARASQLLLDGAAEPKVGDGDPMTTALERGRDVLHAEGLDAEERTETESFVSGDRTQQEDVHGRTRKRNIGDPQ